MKRGKGERRVGKVVEEREGGTEREEEMKGGRDELLCSRERARNKGEAQKEIAHDAVLLHAGLRPPVSLAKNKPGRRGEDSSPLSFIYLHLCLFCLIVPLLSLQVCVDDDDDDDYTCCCGSVFVFSTALFHFCTELIKKYNQLSLQ